MQHRAVTILLTVVWIFTSERTSEACIDNSRPYPLIARNNSFIALSCVNPNFDMLSVLWGAAHFVSECKPNIPTDDKPFNGPKNVTMTGGCSPAGVDANVTLGPVEDNKNAQAMYCNYEKGDSCYADYFVLFVYVPGSLQLVTTMQNASGLPIRSVSNEWNQQTADSPANQLRVRVDTALQSGKTEFNFSCSFLQCGSTHEPKYTWIITSDSNVSTGSLTTWDADDQFCEYSAVVDADDTELDPNPTQLNGNYPSRSYASWNAGSFLAALCSNPASPRSVRVRVGYTVQYRVYTNVKNFTWSNDPLDAVWQTIVFECPSSEPSEKGLLGMSQVQLIGVGVGLVVALMVIIIVTCIIVRARCSRNAHEAIAQEDQAQQTNTIGVSNNSQFGKKVPYEA